MIIEAERWEAEKDILKKYTEEVILKKARLPLTHVFIEAVEQEEEPCEFIDTVNLGIN